MLVLKLSPLTNAYIGNFAGNNYCWDPFLKMSLSDNLFSNKIVLFDIAINACFVYFLHQQLLPK